MPKTEKADTKLVELDISKTVRKSNVLNEMRNANINMAEYRLFCVYLAHFNMNGDNVVTFKLSDYAHITGLDRPRREDLVAQAENIMSRTLQVDNADGGFDVYAFFTKFKLHHEADGWYVTLKANEELSPLLREQSRKFIRYKLYNTIFLKSFNQQRIYELLKQYQKIGERVISLKDLREYLSIGESEYPVWYDFSSKVLKVAQKAIKENTDISFEYEPIKKGRPVVAVKFTVRSNGAYKDRLKLGGWLPEGSVEEFDGEGFTVTTEEVDPDQLTIDDYDDYEDDYEDVTVPDKYEDPLVFYFAEACNEEFSEEEMKVLIQITRQVVGTEFTLSLNDNNMRQFRFLKRAYGELNLSSAKNRVNTTRFHYLKGILQKLEVIE